MRAVRRGFGHAAFSKVKRLRGALVPAFRAFLFLPDTALLPVLLCQFRLSTQNIKTDPEHLKKKIPLNLILKIVCMPSKRST